MTAPQFPSMTSLWHADTYAAIDPKRPELSARGKTVIITGAGSGIGRATAKAFAEAGASHVALIGRRLANISETKALVVAESPSTRVTLHVADVVDVQATKKAAADIGEWDVLLLNAAYQQSPGRIGDSEVEDWWKTFEVNVLGNMIGIKAFLPSRKTDAVILASASAVVSQPLEMMKNLSAYTASKMAQLKLLELLGCEYEDVRVMPIHPGVVTTTAISVKSEAMVDGFEGDKVELGAHFFVWAASREAAFAKGKMLWANWDVDQLKTRAAEFKADPLILTSNTIGWPYTPAP